MICTPQQIISGDQVKTNEMGGACNTYGGEEMCICDFGGDLHDNGWGGGGRGLDWSASGQGQVAVCCERGDEPSGFHKMQRIS
jgi:hypothetical protein